MKRSIIVKSLWHKSVPIYSVFKLMVPPQVDRSLLVIFSWKRCRPWTETTLIIILIFFYKIQTVFKNMYTFITILKKTKFNWIRSEPKPSMARFKQLSKHTQFHNYKNNDRLSIGYILPKSWSARFKGIKTHTISLL